MAGSISEALGERGFGLALAVAILYTVFLIGWVFRKHLGVPPSRLKGRWVILILMPAVLAALMLADGVLPRWVMTLATIAFIAFVAPRFRARQAHAEQTDPLCGRPGVVVTGQPAELRVRVDGELWNARTEAGRCLLEGDRVLVKRRGLHLVVE